MKNTVFALALSICALPVGADTKRDLAEDYIEMPAIQNMIDEMFSPETMKVQFEAGLPASVTFSEDQIDKVAVLLSSALQDLKPQIEAAMLESTVRVFSEDEISSMIAFYSTENGEMIMAKMSTFFADYMKDIGPEIQKTNVRLMPEIQKILSE